MLVLDEPFRGVDIQSQQAIVHALKSHRANGGGVLLCIMVPLFWKNCGRTGASKSAGGGSRVALGTVGATRVGWFAARRGDGPLGGFVSGTASQSSVHPSGNASGELNCHGG